MVLFNSIIFLRKNTLNLNFISNNKTYSLLLKKHLPILKRSIHGSLLIRNKFTENANRTSSSTLVTCKYWRGHSVVCRAKINK